MNPDLYSTRSVSMSDLKRETRERNRRIRRHKSLEKQLAELKFRDNQDQFTFYLDKLMSLIHEVFNDPAYAGPKGAQNGMGEKLLSLTTLYVQMIDCLTESRQIVQSSLSQTQTDPM